MSNDKAGDRTVDNKEKGTLSGAAVSDLQDGKRELSEREKAGRQLTDAEAAHVGKATVMDKVDGHAAAVEVIRDIKALSQKGALTVESGGQLLEETARLWNKMSKEDREQFAKELTAFGKEHPEAKLALKFDNSNGQLVELSIYNRTFVNMPNEDRKDGSYFPAEMLTQASIDRCPNPMDKEVLQRPLGATNCHDYTCLRLGIAPALDLMGLGAATQLNPMFLNIAGYHETKIASVQDLQPGDVVAVPYPHVTKDLLFGHSGIVERDASGKLVIREKLGPGRPFVDQTPDAFAGTWSKSNAFAGNPMITVYRRQ